MGDNVILDKLKFLDALTPLLPDNWVAVQVYNRVLNEQDEITVQDIVAMCRDLGFAVLLALPHKVVNVPGRPTEVK